MRKRSFLLALLVAAGSIGPVAPARAEISSTVDEWLERFIPEAGPIIKLPGYADDFDRAKAEVLAGKYRAALSTLSKIDKPTAETDLLKARSLFALGEADDAEKLLKGPSLAKDIPAMAFYGRVLIENDRLDEAAKVAADMLAAKPDSVSGHLLKGLVEEEQGQFTEAAKTYDWFLTGQQAFVQKWNGDPASFEDAEELVDIATAIDHWAQLTLSYKEQRDLNDMVLNMYLRAFDVVDRSNISGRVMASAFALSRGNNEAAMKYLEPAIKRAPLNRDVLIQFAEIGLAINKEDVVGMATGGMRSLDPDSSLADFYEARQLVRSGQPIAAADRAAALVARKPKNLVAIGLDGAMRYVLGDESKIDAAIARADAISPNRSDAHLAAALVLTQAHQQDIAEKLLKTVIKRTPWVAEASHVLGDIYVDQGREDEAKAVLQQAYELDRYNITTVNYLRLIDELNRYEKRVSAHFILYYDRDADPIIADQIGEFMEQTYDDVTKIFQYEPKVKVVVQIYPNDDEFSVRMAGVPGVENYGVSFGRVLAAVSPRKGTHKGTFNYARILRHEFVHTVNLLQTRFRCPRWLTEGLAVWQEGVPFRFKEVPQILYKRAMEDKLFTVRGLAMVYIRPKDPADGEQAYTQAAYLARYLDETYGRESILKLLNAYANAKGDEEAFLAATGDPLQKVETEWHAWMRDHLKSWGYDAKTMETVKALTTEGEQAIKKQDYPLAVKTWEQIYALQPNEMKVNQRLAFLYLQEQTSDPEKAIEHLKFLHVLDLANDKLAKQIARLYIKQNDLPSALEWAKQATYVDVYDPTAHELMAEVYDKMNKPKEAEASRQIVKQIELWEVVRKKPKTPPADAPETPAAPAGEKDGNDKP